MWEGPAAERVPRFSTFGNMARLELAIGGDDAPERIRPILERAAATLAHHGADDRLTLAGLYAQIGDRERAIDLAREAARVGRPSGLPDMYAASLLAQLGQRDVAADLLSTGVARAKGLGPNTGRAGSLSTAADVHARLGNSAEAAALYLEAAEIIKAGRLPTGRAWDLFGVAQSIWNLGSQTNNPALVHQSLALFESARELMPESALIRADLAQRYASFDRLDDAEREMTAAATLGDKNPQLARALSSLLAARGRPQESVQWEAIAKKRERGGKP
jgi:tetratricopeptide (TPR) repeat protein